MRHRTSKMFSSLSKAEAFAASMNAEGRAAIVVPMVNAEDAARGYANPRIHGYKVPYWEGQPPIRDLAKAGLL